MSTGALHFCFIIEPAYRESRLPAAVIEQLGSMGHECTVIAAEGDVVDVEALASRHRFAAAVLRTMSGGAGLTLLHTLGAAGVPTINSVEHVLRVRDKLAMAAIARASGVPFPRTWHVGGLRSLERLPDAGFPLVLKPTAGGFGRGVRVLRSRDELLTLDPERDPGRYIAQSLVENSGEDLKLYNTGQEIVGVQRRSSLFGGPDKDRWQVPVSDELRALALRVGEAYGLDLYGLDVVEGPDGPVVVDVNDFPSYGTISEAPQQLAESIVHIALRAGLSVVG